MAEIRSSITEMEETAFETDDDSKIKPEIELKEGSNGFVYEADCRGHLQLVHLNNDISNACGDAVDINHADNSRNLSSIDSIYKPSYQHHIAKENICNYETGDSKQWNQEKVLPVLENESHIADSWDGHELSHNNVYKKPENTSSEDSFCIKEETPKVNDSDCSYGRRIAEIYDYSSDSTWDAAPFSSSSQNLDIQKSFMKSDSMSLLTQAEKKRIYRMRIKEENPAMWSSIKKKEAARKREQREKRRSVLFEMQRAMEFASLPDTPEIDNQKLYLEALKERYPELWNQLINAIPETQARNEQVYMERNPKSRRNLPKPARTYKDVIEAQKKRLYRQRLKEERPEMYERQKARDARARSLQRLSLRKNGCLEKDTFCMEDEMECNKLTYLHNLHIEHNNDIESKEVNSHLSDQLSAMNSNSVMTQHLQSSLQFSCSKSDPSHVCDNMCSGYDAIHNLPSNELKSNIIVESALKSITTACSTQSDILWYWNDVHNNQDIDNPSEAMKLTCYSKKRPQVLTEEERLEKILKERMQLREKRRRYRMNMSPEKRIEFLEIERERLKAYRLKKKVASLTSDESYEQINVEPCK